MEEFSYYCYSTGKVVSRTSEPPFEAKLNLLYMVDFLTHFSTKQIRIKERLLNLRKAYNASMWAFQLQKNKIKILDGFELGHLQQ